MHGPCGNCAAHCWHDTLGVAVGTTGGAEVVGPPVGPTTEVVRVVGTTLGAAVVEGAVGAAVVGAAVGREVGTPLAGSTVMSAQFQNCSPQPL